MNVSRIENIHKRFGKKRALQGVSCELQEGIIALLGPQQRGQEYPRPKRKDVGMMKIGKRLRILLLLAVYLLALSGCNQVAPTPSTSINPETPSTSVNQETVPNYVNFANAVMDSGAQYAARDGFIYFSDYVEHDIIYEYDTLSGKTVKLVEFNKVDPIIGEVIQLPKNFFVTETYVGYMFSVGDEKTAFGYVTRDGKESGILFVRDTSFTTPIVDGDTVYFRDGVQDPQNPDLYRQRFVSRSLETGAETVLLEAERTLICSMDEKYFSAVTCETTESGKTYHLLRSDRTAVSFEEISLSVEPIRVMPVGEDLFISQKGDYQLYRWSNGQETQLPIRSTRYQIFDGHVVYLDSTEGDTHGMPLKKYNLETGEITEIHPYALKFSILDGPYIGIDYSPEGTKIWHYLYNWQTGETLELPIPIEE